MRFGITFGRIHHRMWREAALEADRLGFESVWLPEHLVLPLEMQGQLVPGQEHPPVPATIPIYDALSYLSYLAALTERVRLGTFVYLLGIRHPFVGARGFATLDLLSSGRALLGAGAGWLVNEWQAAGLDPATRGARLDEAIEICRRLWTEPVVEYHGAHFDFPPVAFEPKPIQQPVPIYVGGESARALRRAARLGDGWIGMSHTPESASDQVALLKKLASQYGRDEGAVSVTVAGECRTASDLAAWQASGVDRLIVNPWGSSREVLQGLRDFSKEFRGKMDY